MNPFLPGFLNGFFGVRDGVVQVPVFKVVGPAIGEDHHQFDGGLYPVELMGRVTDDGAHPGEFHRFQISETILHGRVVRFPKVLYIEQVHPKTPFRAETIDGIRVIQSVQSLGHEDHGFLLNVNHPSSVDPVLGGLAHVEQKKDPHVPDPLVPPGVDIVGQKRAGSFIHNRLDKRIDIEGIAIWLCPEFLKPLRFEACELTADQADNPVEAGANVFYEIIGFVLGETLSYEAPVLFVIGDVLVPFPVKKSFYALLQFLGIRGCKINLIKHLPHQFVKVVLFSVSFRHHG